MDYCPKCRGIWLDRGELDTLIERSKATGYGAGCPTREHPEQGYHQEARHHEHHSLKGRERKSFREEVFDFCD